MQAVERIAAILQALRPIDGKRDYSLAEITHATQLSHVTVRRILQALETYQWVETVPGTRRYRLGVGLIQLGYAAWSGFGLRTIAHDALVAAARQSGDTAYLAVRHGADEGIFIDHAESGSTFRIVRPLGVPDPLHEGAAKMAILAYLPEQERAEIVTRLAAREMGPDIASLQREIATIRSQGYAVSTEEGLFVSGVGVPIFNADNAVVGAVSLTGPLLPDDIERAGARTRIACATAAMISARLGYAIDAPAAPWRPPGT